MLLNNVLQFTYLQFMWYLCDKEIDYFYIMKSDRSADKLTAIKLSIFYHCHHAPPVTLGKPFRFGVFRLMTHPSGQVLSQKGLE